MHLDGARIWNAMVKTDVPANVGKLFDTVSVCFSKGIGNAGRLDADGTARFDCVRPADSEIVRGRNAASRLLGCGV